MKKTLLFLIALFLWAGSSWGQVTVTGCTGAGNGSYATLNAAFTAIEATQTGASVLIEISGNTTEPATSSTLVAGTWTTLTIQPSGGPWTISGAATAGTPLLIFNGSDNVTVNGGGNLIIANTTVSSSTGTSTLKLTADATSNTFNNVTFQSSGTGTLGSNVAAVWISTGTTTGNDNNSFQSCKFTSAGSNLPSQCIVANGSTGSTAIENSGITINNCEFYDYFLATGSHAAVYASTGNTNWTVTNNKIYQTASRTITSASSVYGISLVNTGATALGEGWTVTGNTIGYNNNSGTGTMTYASGTTSGGFYGITISGSTASTSTFTITNNTISNIQWTSTTSSVFYGIYVNTLTNTTIGAVLNVTGNTVQNIATITTTGSNFGIYAGGYAPTTTINTNTISSMSRSGAGIFYGIYYAGTSSTSVTLNGNNIHDLLSTSTSSTSSYYGMYSGSSPATEIVTNNNIYNLSSSSTAAQTLIGWYNNTASGTKTVQNNNIYNLSLPATSTGTIYGKRLAYGTAVEVSGNKVYTLTGGTNIYGISFSASGSTINVFKNKVYDLASSVSSASVSGFYVSTATTANIYNNFVGDLRATAATGLNAVMGLNLSATATYNIYFNTIFLNASSSSVSTFGTSGVYFSSTATSLNLRNNVIVNLSTPAQEGANLAANGISAVLRRSSGSAGVVPANYTATSNNNNFWCNPTAGSNNHNSYVEGTSTVTNALNTVAQLKAFMVTRDQASFGENPSFVSTTGADATFLHINTGIATQIESGASAIGGITNDYDGDVRNITTPDIGADEFSGIGMDLSGPAISYTNLVKGISEPSRNFTAVAISDPSTVNTTAGTKPRVYYKKSTDANDMTGWVYVEANESTSPFDFTINHTLLSGGGVSEGDVIQYFVVAQDLASTPNVGINSGSFASSPASVDLTGAAFPIGGTINSYNIVSELSGTKTVGTGGDYTTLTAADGFFAAVNANVISGNITVNIISDITETGVTALNQWDESGAGNYTITIQPDGTTERLLSSVSASVLVNLNGADRLVFDGRFSGSGKYLRIRNTNTGYATFKFTNGASSNTIRYCYIEGANTTAASGVIEFAASGNNNSNLIDNCIIRDRSDVAGKPANGLYFASSSNASTNGISNNEVFNFTSYGILLTGATSTSISNNQIYMTSASTQSSVYGISIGNAPTTLISGNKIFDLSGGATASVKGIYYPGASGVSMNVDILNNSIIMSPVTTGTIDGIDYYGYAANSCNLYFNSVLVSGSHTSGSNATSAFRKRDAATTINIKNNAFVNARSNSGATSKHYAVAYTSTTTTSLSINYNDYYASGTGGVLGIYNAADVTTLENWKTATTQDANSISGDPLFTSSTNLLPLSGTPLMAAGTPIDGITTDINGDTRSLTTPTIGAYELEITAALDWANLQHPANVSIPEGSSASVYARVYEDGVTNGAGQGAGIQCWIGWNAANTNPNTWTNWTVATYNTDNGNNDEYTATIGGSLAAGTYYYASRFIITDGAYQYGGYNVGGGGFWDGTANVSGVLTVTNSDISWANLQSPETATITEGGTTSVYGRVYVADVTSIAGASSAIQAWVGWNSADTDPSTWSNWTAASFNVQSGNNDEYQASIGAALTPGTYYYATRFKFMSDAYVYGGYSVGGGGLWDGTTYESGVLTVNPVTLTVPHSQGFEGTTFAPAGWTTSNVLGAQIWARSTSDFHSGVACASITYQSTGGEDWLITPRILSIADGDQLSFYWENKFGDAYPPDQLEVLVSTTDAMTASFTASLGVINTGVITATWQQVSYSLSSYVGQNIYIAFKHTNTDGNGINLDDVSLSNNNTQWTGSVSTDWTVAGNWSNGVPTSAMTSIIEDVTNNPVIATAVTVNNLTINAGGILSIAPAGQLTVTTGITNSGGTAGLVIESDATGTGSLIHNTTDVAATVERYIAGSSTTNQYHLVSVPLTAANNPQAGLFLGSYLYYFDQPTQTFVSPGTSVTSPLDVQRGYMIHYPNTATTYEFAGTINAGDFTANTSHHSVTIGVETYTGFNLVPNPYPSAIDWDALTGWTKTNIIDAIWIWNPGSGNYAAYGDDAGTNGATNYIPAGQAFFVQSSASSPVLSMTNTTRVHNSQAFLKDAPVIKDMLRLNAASNGFSDELIVRFLEQSIVANGQKNVAKMTGSASAPQLYSISSENEKLSINNLPFSAETVIIPIGFELDATKDVTFSFSSIESFEPTVTIFLEDSFNGQMVNLRENPVYTFNHTQGNEPQRFKLHLMGVTAVGETPSALTGQIWSDGQSLYLSFPELQGQKARYELFDLNGRLLESRELSLETIQRVQPQASGIVIARVSLANQVFVNKLFIR